MAAASPSDQSHIILFDVDDGLFKSCFGKDEDWSCRFVSLSSESCSTAALDNALCQPGLLSVVFMDMEGDHVNVPRNYYVKGGLVVYFGIYGEFADPEVLSRTFGIGPWSFSGYTAHNYQLTLPASQKFGNNVKLQQYTKSNLVNAPVKDRLMTPKELSYDEYIEEYLYPDDDGNYDEEDLKLAPQKYESHRESMGTYSPLVMHESFNGGAAAYLGFVNGDGNIPLIVRALLTKQKI
mmetsp:Transcript_25624/g.39370  ORF Transcript_25624/g.39370 Transcript_25624/m.39370 type:complete len:237 (+) Transcript_25624:87-797(+)